MKEQQMEMKQLLDMGQDVFDMIDSHIRELSPYIVVKASDDGTLHSYSAPPIINYDFIRIKKMKDSVSVKFKFTARYFDNLDNVIKIINRIFAYADRSSNLDLQ